MGIPSRLGYSSRAAHFPYDSVGLRTQSSFGMFCVYYTYSACGVEGVAMISISSILRKNDDLSFDIAELYDGVTTAKSLLFFFLLLLWRINHDDVVSFHFSNSDKNGNIACFVWL